MARRNANGEGSIYRRKDGRYEGAVYVLTTSGAKKRVRVYGATRAEASKKLTETKAKNDQGIPIADRSWKLGEYLDYWLEEVVKPHRRPNTYAQCETIVRLYLKPGLGERDIQKLSVSAVQAYLNSIYAAGKSAANVRVMKKVLSAALTRAMREELITRNVARLIELPSDAEEKKDVEPWRVAEIATFLETIQAHRLYAAYLLLALYGLRRGELLGLRWKDVDIENRELHLRQQLTRVGRQLLFGPLKTKASRRNLPLVTPLLQALHEHYEEQRARGITSELVFTTDEGTPIEPRNFTRSFERLCKRNGLRVITVHNLRHTQATVLMRLGIPARTIQLLLGHSRITTTQEIYQHSDGEAQREALQIAEKHLLPHKAPAQDKTDGTLTHFVDGNRCRQNSRQTRKNPTTWLGFFSGASTGTLTLDLFHGKKTQATLAERITEVDATWNMCRRMWMMGAVAVSVAVKDTRGDEHDLNA